MLVRFSCFLLLMGHSYSFPHKLPHGKVLKDGDELVSASGKFKFGHFTPSSTPYSSKRYVGVWYNKPTDRTKSLYNEDEVQSSSKVVLWIANRNNPILHKSSTLRIDSSDGNLKIFPNGDENPVEITSVGAVRNITCVSLLKSGNLVLHVPYLNGSINHVLWQSFDYPTDTLLPGMKLGINFQTGHQWFLQSWLAYDSPDQGRFNVGMDPNVTSQLMVSCRGQVDQTSGDLVNGKFKSWDIIGYNFSYISNKKEKYFTYSVSEDVTSFPMLQIDWHGSLRDDRGQSIASCSMFDQYGVSDEYKRPRTCNASNSYLVPKSGFMSGDGIKLRESDNMTLADCRQKCFKDCSCVAYAAANRANDTGCEIWSRGTEFKESNDDNNSEIYVEFIPPVVDSQERPSNRSSCSSSGDIVVFIELCSKKKIQRTRGEVVAVTNGCFIGTSVMLLLLFSLEETHSRR
ncbi:hypothetical protein Ddye_014712 [Dipteronia dyeriana]|uniref:Uncharacterized protein n=1 Tax=Dipteronia dyeriana TaxID=168575 RepID=A0AAD9X8C7_9ROSI|nr:hypothetical protein Ddye_014712 [Dipteronia dyeriana]